MTGAAARRVRPILHRIERSTLAALETTQPCRLLVALSGGADSSAALIALTERAARHGWRVEAAYLDHGIAPPAVRSGFRHTVEAVTDRFGVPLHTGAADVLARAAASRLGVEEAARRERYAFLARTARAIDVAAVVTGHTSTDQAETVLLHLIRGSGLDGLGGMRVRAPLPTAEADGAPPLIRPLLSVSRSETETVCRAFGVAPADDPANGEQAFTRNRIRHEIVPLLRELNPQVEEALRRLADTAQADADALDQATARAVAELTQRARPGPLGVSRHALLRQPPAVRRRVVRALAHSAGAPTLSYERTGALVGLLNDGGGEVELGGGVTAEARRDRLTFRFSRANTGNDNVLNRLGDILPLQEARPSASAANRASVSSIDASW